MPNTQTTLDTFTRAYIACALWSSTDNADDSGGEPLDANYNESDIAPATLAEIISDCAAFQTDNADDLRTSRLSDEQAGHDFWLTRNGCGAGFWDRGLGKVGKTLTDAAHVWGSVNLYVGDDDQIYA